MKTIDTKSYLSSLCEIAQKGESVCTVVSGGSMVPFLSGNKDYVYLEVPKRRLRKGDIVLFTRTNGDFVLHRIKKIRKDGYYLTGDRQTVTEGPVSPEQIRLLATKVKRKGVFLTEKSLKWKFYSKIWNNLMFLRPAVFSVLSVIRKNKKPR